MCKKKKVGVVNEREKKRGEEEEEEERWVVVGESEREGSKERKKGIKRNNHLFWVPHQPLNISR